MDRIIQGTYSDFKYVKTRSVLQIIVEVPIEAAGDAFTLLGIPNPSKEQWVAVTLLQTPGKAATNAPAAKVKTRWEDMSATKQACILCGDLKFQEWATQTFWDAPRSADSAEADARQIICTHFGINSRKDLGNFENGWKMLVYDYHRDTNQTAEMR